MTNFISIAEAKKMRSGINTKGVIESVGERRTINLKTGGTVDVCDAVLKDSSDNVKLSLWGDDIGLIKKGSSVELQNAYSNEFKGEVSLTKGKFGQMNVS